MTYSMKVGRNFAEILRVIGALQTGDTFRIATPADWEVGKDVIVPPYLCLAPNNWAGSSASGCLTLRHWG